MEVRWRFSVTSPLLPYGVIANAHVADKNEGNKCKDLKKDVGMTPCQKCREGVAVDCCMLSIHLSVSSCFNSFWHSVVPTFYTCITHNPAALEI